MRGETSPRNLKKSSPFLSRLLRQMVGNVVDQLILSGDCLTSLKHPNISQNIILFKLYCDS